MYNCKHSRSSKINFPSGSEGQSILIKKGKKKLLLQFVNNSKNRKAKNIKAKIKAKILGILSNK